MRLWYARRGIPWVPFLACLALAGVSAVVLGRWPQVTGALAPAAMAGCAAAAGFVFDEPALAATAVTPRGGRWAWLSRSAVVLLPAAAWLVFATRLPIEGHRTNWVLLGLGGQSCALLLAWWSSRRGATAPGSAIAPAVVVLLLMPFAIGPMLGWNGL